MPHSPALAGREAHGQTFDEVSASEPPPLPSSATPELTAAAAPLLSAARQPSSSQLDEAEAALRNACLQLTDRTDADADANDEIERAVTQMVGLARLIQSQPPVDRAAFATVGKATCAEELCSFLKHARALADALDGLHQPTILALADVGFETWCRTVLPSVLRQMAAQARRANVPEQPPNAGRGAKPRNAALAIARVAGQAYRNITGKLPSFTTDPGTSERRGQWPTFLKAACSAVGIEYGDRLMRQIVTEMAPSK